MSVNAETFGAKVLALRKAKGWSREDLAYNARVAGKTISRIENGEVEDPRRNTVRAIADALGVDEYALLGEPESPEGVTLSAQIDAVTRDFRQDVDEIKSELAIAREERATLREEIETQQRNLATQTELLEAIRAERQEAVETLNEIRELVSVLQDVGHVERAAVAAVRALPDWPASPSARQPRSQPGQQAN